MGAVKTIIFCLLMAEVSIPVISCVKLQLYNYTLCEQISENTVKLQVWKLKHIYPYYSSDQSGLWRWHFNRESHEAVIYFSLHKHLNLSSDFFRQLAITWPYYIKLRHLDYQSYFFYIIQLNYRMWYFLK